MAVSYKHYWFPIQDGILRGNIYAYSVEHNIITDKYKIVFKGLKEWNKQVKVVRYYSTQPTDKNICLTVRTF